MKNFTWLTKFKNRATNEEILENINDGVSLNISDLFILMCAIIIACVGLNMNASAVIIGAMLISPIMGPIIGIGYGVGTYDARFIRKALKLLAIEVLISIVTATIYFKLSPITGASAQLISRTSPTIWDVIIAFVGGTAGIIGISRKSPGNVVPGVAIATALMPPLCTAGYGIARWNLKIFLGAGYLFLINSFFIGVSTIIVIKLLKMPKHEFVDALREKKIKTIIVISAIIVVIPSIISAVHMIDTTVQTNNLNNFITGQISSESYVLEKSIDKADNSIDLVLVGTPISTTQIQTLDTKLPDYGFTGYKLNITQSSDLSLKSYFEKIQDQNNGLLSSNSTGSQTTTSVENKVKETVDKVNAANYDKVATQLQAIYPDIDKVIIGEGQVSYENKPIETTKSESTGAVDKASSTTDTTKIDADKSNTPAAKDTTGSGNSTNQTKDAKGNIITNPKNPITPAEPASQSVLMVQIDTANSKLLTEQDKIKKYFEVSTGNANVLVSINIVKKAPKTKAE